MSLSLPMVPNQVHTRNPIGIFFPFLEPGSTETEVTCLGSHRQHCPILPVSCCLLLLALALVSASVPLSLLPSPRSCPLTPTHTALGEAQIHQTSKMTPTRLLMRSVELKPSCWPLTFPQGIKHRADFLPATLKPGFRLSVR